ncbi:stage II sporulation protein P [Metabacillus malikii]|uniref:Stage II sporulation protein P n=1 Tax=Metabacillus malikii TaxID=1504265 RepID=A0ABT9ZEK6_9BACI|nr:stage II sporulation protein P [Metabacillus malikii]MDQ0230271.1 stage II sporulation protein P [Metabacillus malikii]
MNKLRKKTLKLLLLISITMLFFLLILVIYLYEKEGKLYFRSNFEGKKNNELTMPFINQSLQRELPGNFETSIELNPDEEALRRDAALNKDKINSFNEPIIKRPNITQGESHSTLGRKVVFIYFSHTRESFLPYFKQGTARESAYHSKLNVALVGKRLGRSLRNNGVWNNVSDIDIINLLNNQNLDFGDSYKMSREVVLQEKRKNNDLEMVFDIHRDSLPKDLTTANINGEQMAKILFIIGSGHKNYKENLNFASKINAIIEKRYSGLSKGVIIKDKSQGNGVYNQDLSPNSVIVEIGGVENTLEELYRSADVLGEAISEYYWDKEHKGK